MIGVVNKVSFFLMCTLKLEESIDQTPHPGQMPVKKLKDSCRTQWFKKIDALDCFKNLLPFLVNCFKTISDAGSSTRWS